MNKFTDHLLTGVIIGILMPVIGFQLFCLFGQDGAPMTEILTMYKNRGVITHVISLSVLSNLPVFFLFLQFKKERTSRGILGATMVWAILVFVMKLL